MNVANYIIPTVDGREAAELDARVFWQSRMTIMGQPVPPLPELVNVEDLARELGR